MASELTFPSVRRWAELRVLRWAIKLRYLPFVAIIILRYPVATVPRLRRIVLFCASFTIPALIAIGLAAQQVSIMTEVVHADIFFTIAAGYIAIIIVLLEDIRPPKTWAMILVIVLLEGAVFLGLKWSISWVNSKASEYAWRLMVKDAEDSRIQGQQFRWQKRQEQAVIINPPLVGSSPVPPKQTGKAKPAAAPLSQPPAKPDISVALVYASGFAIMLLNTSDVVLRDPKFAVVVWDLDLPDRADPLPIPTQGFNDWIRPHEAIGPEQAISRTEVMNLIKKGDRLFGYIWVSCPECLRTKYYWVYAILGTSGWYAELPKGRFPLTNTMFRMLPEIKRNPEAFVRDISESDRKPIVELP